MAAKHWRSGVDEFRRSLSKTEFVLALQRLVPEVTEEDLVPGGSGVRAQAFHAVGGFPTKGHWHPEAQTGAWQWQLQGKFQLTPGADVYDIDAFESTVGNVRAIHRHRAKAICYVDVGSWEEYRPDAGKFPASVLGKRYEGFPEERWLDIRHFHEFAAIMEKRFDLCAHKRFDAVEPDNINAWENNTGFPLTRAD